jgi:hypothetical protein
VGQLADGVALTVDFAVVTAARMLGIVMLPQISAWNPYSGCECKSCKVE